MDILLLEAAQNDTRIPVYLYNGWCSSNYFIIYQFCNTFITDIYSFGYIIWEVYNWKSVIQYFETEIRPLKIHSHHEYPIDENKANEILSLIDTTLIKKSMHYRHGQLKT